MQSVQSLNDQFGIPDTARFEQGEGGLPRLVITTPQATAHIYTLGAHITHWQPTGTEPVLFMSDESWFEEGKPIRGGVPVCYPWFGPHPDHSDWPNHAFARYEDWQVVLVTTDPAGRVIVELQYTGSEHSKQFFPYDFEARITFTVGGSLTMKLATRNLGDQPFTITEALHTYFQVSDVKQVSIVGLEGAKYLSKTEGGEFEQPNEPLRFTKETDRVFMGNTAPCVLHDPGFNRVITVEKAGSNSTVVWNPWIDKAANMPDFGNDEWPSMVCIETANALKDAVTIPAGESHEMQATLNVKQG